MPHNERLHSGSWLRRAVVNSPLCLVVPITLYAAVALATLNLELSQTLFVFLYQTGNALLFVFPVIQEYHEEMVEKLTLERAFAITSINIVLGYMALLYAIIATIHWRTYYRTACDAFDKFARADRLYAVIRAILFIGVMNVPIVLGILGFFESNIGQRPTRFNTITRFDSNVATLITSAVFATSL